MSSFVIRNGGKIAITYYLEPEGTPCTLGAGEEIVVNDSYEKDPMMLEIAQREVGCTFSLWPGDGDVSVVASP